MSTFPLVKPLRLGSEDHRERDRKIKKLRDQGADSGWIADHFNISQTRVNQIINQEKQNERNGYR